MQQQRIETVGKLGSTYGIRGWLRIYSSTEQAESIFDYQPWFLKIKGQWQPTELENWRHHNHELIVKLRVSMIVRRRKSWPMWKSVSIYRYFHNWKKGVTTGTI